MRQDNRDERGITTIHLRDTAAIIDAGAKLSGKTRSAYIREKMVEAATRDIDEALGEVERD